MTKIKVGFDYDDTVRDKSSGLGSNIKKHKRIKRNEI